MQLEKGTLAVRRTLTRGLDGKWTTGDPKRASGKRPIKLPASAVDALRRHKAEQNERRLALGTAWHDGDLVLDRGDGHAYEPTSVYSAFKKLCAAADVPCIRPHDLRHTAATLLLASGVLPKIVAERLGHSSVSMTLDRYSHVAVDMQESAADALEAALG